MSIFLYGAATALPQKIMRNNDFPIVEGALQENLMFTGTKERRHCAPTDSTADYLVPASQKLLQEFQLDVDRVALFMANATQLDIPFTGVCAAWVGGLQAHPRAVYDIHNSGCTSFVIMAELAQNLMACQAYEYALIGNVQLSAGKIFAEPQNMVKPQSVVPGDGCGVTLFSTRPRSGAGELVGVATAIHAEFANDMYIERPDGSHWWQPSPAMGIIEFSKEKSLRILSRGNRSVPQRIQEVCEKAGKRVTDISFLITNQPNGTFLRNWREFAQLPEEKQYHTFSTYGNLFGAAMPINLSEALAKGLIQEGDLVCVAGFSHAGDYSGALLLQY